MSIRQLRPGDERPGRDEQAPAHQDRGASFVEIIITISLLGVVVAAILTATATGIRVSSLDRAAAQVETAIVNASDRLNRAPKRCDYTIYAQAAVQTQGWEPSTVSLVHEYYVPGPSAGTEGTWTTGAPTSPACPGPAPEDLLVQRITMSITSPNGDVTRSIQVVKSDV